MTQLSMLWLTLKTLLSMLYRPKRNPERDWKTELTCRLLQNLLQQSKKEPIAWLRQRQQAVSIKSPAAKLLDEQACTIADTPCTWFRNKDNQSTRPIVLYFHGGGYVVGSVASYRNFLQELTVLSGAEVLGVDYRLGPEAVFPAAQDDCLAITKAILEQYPSKAIILAGDSAGGALALATYQSLQQENSITLPKALILLSPWVDPHCNRASMQAKAATDILDKEIVQTWFNAYVSPEHAMDKRLQFNRLDLNSLPPTYIQAAQQEVFIDQIRGLFGRAGTPPSIRYEECPGMFHIFQILTPNLAPANDAVARLAEFICEQ